MGKLSAALSVLDKKSVLQVVTADLGAGRNPLDLIEEAREALQKVGEEVKGKLLIGTVSGDVHDLGKGIVASLLEGEGFEVVDLGVDVPEKIFVDKIKEHNPQVVGMSGLLTTSIPVMGKTVQAIADSGLRGDVKIIVGGGVVGEIDPSRIGADFTTSNANEGVRMINEWTRKRGRRREL